MEHQLSKPRRWLILLNVAVSVFMATLDGSIVNIALPVISKELSVNISSIQWVVTSYLLTISVLLLIWGKISDIYGKKLIFAFGFIIFTFGSLLCGISASLELLVFSRILQAIGASSLMALSQGIITSVFPANERGKALGLIGATVAIGSLSGPILGGALVYAAGWRSIFLINIPIGLIGSILTFLIIPVNAQKETIHSFDYKGSFLFVTSILLLFLGLLFVQEGNISVPAFIVMFVLSIADLLWFLVHEKHIDNPLISLNLFKNRIFSFGISSAFLSFVAMYATLLFLPFYLQFVLELNTFNAGLLLSFYPATTAVIAPISGWLSDKITYRPLTVIGLTINTLTLFWITRLSTKSSFVEIAALFILLGLGGALFQSPNNSSVMGSVPKDQLGIAGGINALFRNLGMVSGTTISVIIFALVAKMNINSLTGNHQGFDTEIFLRGFKAVILAAALSSLCAVVISLIRVVGGRHRNL